MTTDPTRAQADEALWDDFIEAVRLKVGVKEMVNLIGAANGYKRIFLEVAARQRLAADSQPLEAKGWRTIDSAPKDGTRIVVCSEGGSVWCDVWWEKMKRRPDRWISFIGRLPFDPVWWQPRPTPPAQSEGSRG